MYVGYSRGDGQTHSLARILTHIYMYPYFGLFFLRRKFNGLRIFRLPCINFFAQPRHTYILTGLGICFYHKSLWTVVTLHREFPDPCREIHADTFLVRIESYTLIHIGATPQADGLERHLKPDNQHALTDTFGAVPKRV